MSVLQEVTDEHVKGMDVSKMAFDSVNSQRLKLSTEEAASRGAFGVPR